MSARLNVFDVTSVEPTMTGRIQDAAQAIMFLRAGDAHATFVSAKTGCRFTYRVVASDPGYVTHFVSVLTAPDFYEYIGCIAKAGMFIHGRKSRIDAAAPSVLAFRWVYGQLQRGAMPMDLEVWHEGRCGRCARRLTVPESIETGMGPECARKSVGGLS